MAIPTKPELDWTHTPEKTKNWAKENPALFLSGSGDTRKVTLDTSVIAGYAFRYYSLNAQA